MRRRNMFLLLGIAGALLTLALFTTLGIRSLNAAPTAADVVLTNTAILNWTGGTTTNSVLTAGVGTNYGATWIGSADATISAGGAQSNMTYLTNDGNAQAQFILSFTTNVTGTFSKAWTVTYTNTTDGGAEAASIVVTISPAGGKAINLMVGAPADETNTAYTVFNCFASNSNAAANTGNASNYTGINGTVYGGMMGIFNTPYTVMATNGNAAATNWVVTVSAANMQLTKTVNISNVSPFGAITTVPYPGALIAYKLAYNNVGAANATTVRIVDTIPTNYVTYSNDTIVARAFADTFANYYSGGGTAKSDSEGNDDASTNSAAADQIVFCPSAGTAPATGGTVNAGANGAYFFRVMLK